MNYYQKPFVRTLAVSQARSLWVVMIAELGECFQNVLTILLGISFLWSRKAALSRAWAASAFSWNFND